MAGMVLWTVVALSSVAHKEFRFLLPILGPCHIFAGVACASAGVELKNWRARVFKFFKVNVRGSQKGNINLSAAQG